MQETLVIIKPDAFERGICLDILERLISKFELIRIRVIQLTNEQAIEHYSHLKEQPYFNEIVAFIVSRPVYVMIFKGDKIIQEVRQEVGPVLGAASNTIRGSFGVKGYKTLVHVSSDLECACEEIKLFFGDSDYLVRHWECGWCGRTGGVISSYSHEALICPGCGKAICPECGGCLFTSFCGSRCGFVEYEDDCVGSCIKCDWKICEQERL